MIADFDGAVDEVWMDAKAWKLFRNNPYVKALMDIRRGDNSTLRLDPMKAKRIGVTFKGWIGEFPIYVYTGKYIDPADGVTKPYIPDNTVVLASSRVEGVRHFGAIMDVEVLRSVESFSNSWVERNPSRRMLSYESSPLLVPYRPNSSMKITVA